MTQNIHGLARKFSVILLYSFLTQRAFNAILHCLVHENEGVMDRRCIKVFKDMLPGPPKRKEEWVSRVRLFSLKFSVTVRFYTCNKYAIYYVTNTIYPICHVTIVIVVKFTLIDFLSALTINFKNRLRFRSYIRRSNVLLTASKIVPGVRKKMNFQDVFSPSTAVLLMSIQLICFDDEH